MKKTFFIFLISLIFTTTVSHTLANDKDFSTQSFYAFTVHKSLNFAPIVYKIKSISFSKNYIGLSVDLVSNSENISKENSWQCMPIYIDHLEDLDSKENIQNNIQKHKILIFSLNDIKLYKKENPPTPPIPLPLPVPYIVHRLDIDSPKSRKHFLINNQKPGGGRELVFPFWNDEFIKTSRVQPFTTLFNKKNCPFTQPSDSNKDSSKF